MAWINPTVLVFFTLAVSASVCAQESADAENFTEPQENSRLEQTAVEQAVDPQQDSLNLPLDAAQKTPDRVDDTPEALQLRNSLEQQFLKLRQTLEQEDAFSLKLAEDYFSYGLLLQKDGQFEAAIDAYVDALHIQKVNYGIYAPEQRPILKSLFEVHYALGNVEDFEDYLERILWVESKNPTLKDDFSYQMLLTVGNRYIDQFLTRPFAGQANVQTLLRAKHHLTAAYVKHRKQPLSVALMPYGELALISYLENQLVPEVSNSLVLEDPRLRNSRNLDGKELALVSYLSNSYSRGKSLLTGYLNKARKENDIPHVVRALVSLGDFNQLYRRHKDATDYYSAAWKISRTLPPDHEVRNLMGEPVALPSFNYAQERQPVAPVRPTLMIPLTLDISDDGIINKVYRGDETEQTDDYFYRARRAAKRLVFRPSFVDGVAQPIESFEHKQRVYQRSSKKK